MPKCRFCGAEADTLEALVLPDVVASAFGARTALACPECAGRGAADRKLARWQFNHEIAPGLTVEVIPGPDHDDPCDSYTVLFMGHNITPIVDSLRPAVVDELEAAIMRASQDDAEAKACDKYESDLKENKEW